VYIEIDDGVLVNLDQVFTIKYKPYHNRGVWVFYGPNMKDAEGECRVLSRPFNSREEARTWLKSIFYTFKGLSVYLEGEGLKDDHRKRKPLEITE
jgi:hypothetical protein